MMSCLRWCSSSSPRASSSASAAAAREAFDDREDESQARQAEQLLREKQTIRQENSQMSLSSDIMDQPLYEKVVLEDNLCNRQMDMDEETQDSSITAPSPVPHPLKRTRVDSETEVISPPPQTPDFLSQGDDSNISIISVTVTEPAKGQNVQPKKSSKRQTYSCF